MKKRASNGAGTAERQRDVRMAATTRPAPTRPARRREAAATGPVSTLRFDEFAAPENEDLSYIADDLRYLAVRIDSLVLDPENLKDHGEQDLPTHQASLQNFGIRRAVVVRRKNRQIEAGNGTVEAARRNGWLYVPAIFADDTVKSARAFAAADNMVATLAPWNDERLKAQAVELDGLLGEFNMEGVLDSMLQDLGLPSLEELDLSDSEDEPADEPAGKAESIEVVHKVIVTCKTEQEQIDLIGELHKRGFACRLHSEQAKPAQAG